VNDINIPVLGPKWVDRDSFTIEEAAEILGLSRWAGYEAAKRGDIPIVTIGRRHIVPRFRLERLMAGAGVRA
jgi:excisionase family DNA binding protein